MFMTARQTKSEGYALHSELAQFCLPPAQKDRSQKLAWVNSICLIYLVIGLAGVKPPPPVIREVAPLDEPVNVPIEQPPVPVTPTQDEPEEQPEDNTEASEAPAIVAVTQDTPAVSFSVPTVGNVLVAAAAAKAPPPRPMRAVESITNRVINLTTTGRQGDRPAPNYPNWALQGNTIMQGTVVLLVTVEPDGRFSSIVVKKSCGHVRLDNHVKDFASRRWSFPAGDTTLQYEVPVQYKVE